MRRSTSWRRRWSIESNTPADHLLLSLRSTNHLLLENLSGTQMGEELMEAIVPIWPRGANSIENHRGKLNVEFAGHPWSCSGLEQIMWATLFQWVVISALSDVVGS